MLDDARAIENLIYSYAARIDAGDYAGVAELFRNGRIVAAPGMVVEGADAVLGLYERSTRLHDDGTPRTHHVTTNVHIELDRATAPRLAVSGTAHSYYTVFQQTEELALQPIIAGRYRDTFHRVDGEWCFDTREIVVQLTGDLSQHLRFDL